MTTSSASAANSLAGDLLPDTAAIAAYLGVSESRARRLCREREIPAFRLGQKKYAMRRSVFARWLEERETETRDELGFRDRIRENDELNEALAPFGVEEPLKIEVA